MTPVIAQNSFSTTLKFRSANFADARTWKEINHLQGGAMAHLSLFSKKWNALKWSCASHGPGIQHHFPLFLTVPCFLHPTCRTQNTQLFFPNLSITSMSCLVAPCIQSSFLRLKSPQIYGQIIIVTYYISDMYFNWEMSQQYHTKHKPSNQ